MRQGGAETKPSLVERFGIPEVNQPLAVNLVGHTISTALYLNVIPVVGLQEMGLVGVFRQDGGTTGRVFYAASVAVVAPEAGCSVMVAAKP